MPAVPSSATRFPSGSCHRADCRVHGSASHCCLFPQAVHLGRGANPRTGLTSTTGVARPVPQRMTKLWRVSLEAVAPWLLLAPRDTPGGTLTTLL